MMENADSSVQQSEHKKLIDSIRLEQRNLALEKIPSGVGVFVASKNHISMEYLNAGYYHMIHGQAEKRLDAWDQSLAFVHPEDRKMVLNEVQRAIAAKCELHVIMRVISGDGKYRWVGIRATHEPIDAERERFYASYEDIHDLMQLRQKLEENDRVFRELLRGSELIYFIYYPGRKAYEVFVLPERFKQMPRFMDNFPDSFLEYGAVSPLHCEQYRQMVKAIDDGVSEAQCDIQICYQGKCSWQRIHMLNFYGVDGIPEKALCYSMDISQLKDAQQLLAEEKLRMRSMASGMLMASCFNVTRDCNIDVHHNESVCYSPQDAQQIESEAVRVDKRIAAQCRDTKAILFSAAAQIPDLEQRRQFLKCCSHVGMMELYESGQREVHLEYRRWTDRGLIWVNTRIALLAEPDTGDVLAFYYTTDINEQKIRQEVMRQLLSSGYDHASFLDLETHRLYRLDVQKEAVLLPPLHGDYEEINAKYIPSHVYEEDQEQCRRNFSLEHIRRQLEQYSTYIVHYRMKPKGEAACRRMEMRIFYLNNERRYIVFGRSDVTKQYEETRCGRERLEAAMRQAESASQSKTNFLARMSHDIRTPLNGIIGMTQLALDEEMTPDARDYIKKIDESSHFLLALVNDILDMSKVESGKMELHPEPYTYPELYQYIKAVIQPLANTRGVQLCIENPFTACALFIDKVRMNQILFNLLSNAIKFTPAGGRVDLLFCNHQENKGKFSYDIVVRDNGIGMSEEFQKKLFRPFEQEYTERNAHRSGSGLGLSIVKSLVDLMGGQIQVKSTPGKGSEFRLHLCFAVVAEPEQKKAALPAEIELTGRKFLVAEDNDINAEIIMALLQKKGASTGRAADGNSALRQFTASAAGEYTAIIMDVQMPGMDGLEATRRIRALPRPDAQQVPIIAMTANAYEEDVQECLAAGMNAHLAKPVDTEILFRTLQQYVR